MTFSWVMTGSGRARKQNLLLLQQMEVDGLFAVPPLQVLQAVLEAVATVRQQPKAHIHSQSPTRAAIGSQDQARSNPFHDLQRLKYLYKVSIYNLLQPLEPIWR